MRDQPVGSTFGFDLLGSFTECQRFGLRADIGEKHVVMATERIEGFAKGDEVAGDQARALVDELIERVLAIGAGLAPIDRTGFIVDGGAIESDVFAVALHG